MDPDDRFPEDFSQSLVQCREARSWDERYALTPKQLIFELDLLVPKLLEAQAEMTGNREARFWANRDHSNALIAGDSVTGLARSRDMEVLEAKIDFWTARWRRVSDIWYQYWWHLAHHDQIETSGASKGYE